MVFKESVSLDDGMMRPMDHTVGLLRAIQGRRTCWDQGSIQTEKHGWHHHPDREGLMVPFWQACRALESTHLVMEHLGLAVAQETGLRPLGAAGFFACFPGTLGALASSV